MCFAVSQDPTNWCLAEEYSQNHICCWWYGAQCAWGQQCLALALRMKPQFLTMALKVLSFDLVMGLENVSLWPWPWLWKLRLTWEPNCLLTSLPAIFLRQLRVFESEGLHVEIAYWGHTNHASHVTQTLPFTSTTVVNCTTGVLMGSVSLTHAGCFHLAVPNSVATVFSDLAITRSQGTMKELLSQNGRWLIFLFQKTSLSCRLVLDDIAHNVVFVMSINDCCTVLGIHKPNHATSSE